MSVVSADRPVDTLRSAFQAQSLEEVLHGPVTALLGVSDREQSQLKRLDIESIFDLATSSVFDAATRLHRAAANLNDPLSKHGAPPADLVRAGAAGKTIGELAFEPISILQGVPSLDATEISQALDVDTVRDLALYPPYLSAKRLLQAAYFPESMPDFDPELPPDLLPKSGEYPTERVQYTTLLLDEIQTSPDTPLVDVESSAFRPIDLKKTTLGDAGFNGIGWGALLTFNQSWYAHGVTLGQLLHSTALAPGESTRIAVVDWSRRSSAGQTETISEQDRLANDMSQNRALTEVTSAVAREAQSGFSSSNTVSTSTTTGTSASSGLDAGALGGLIASPSISGSSTFSTSADTGQADSFSSSSGQREVGSSMMQNINDRTHQQASSTRSRRASVVKEVSQSESENVSTRVICNYNHMHALTLQYYEVVQIYRVELELRKAERVIFIPVALADFNDNSIVRRYQSVLWRAGLTPEVRTAIRNLDVIEIAPEPATPFFEIGMTLESIKTNAVLTYADPADAAKVYASWQAARAATESAAETNGGSVAGADGSIAAPATATTGPLSLKANHPTIPQVNDRLWTRDQASRLAGLLNEAVLRADSNSLFLPVDCWIEEITAVSGELYYRPAIHLQGGRTVTAIDPVNPIALSEVTAIGLTRGFTGSGTVEDSITATMTLNRNGVRFPVTLPAVKIARGGTGETKIVKIDPGAVNTNLKQHLMDNRLHYSQAILRSLDAAQIALMLSGYTIKVGDQQRPLAQLVGPTPIRYIGNLLAFRISVDPEDEAWKTWLSDHGIAVGSKSGDIVPLPSGGTFAEAVLGRANAAEKLDLTRFWNWQDSPIPMQATEIAAIQTGSRAQSEDTRPGQLSAPIINQMTPSTLPDPTGTAAILAAIQNGAMFRDMSGLQATINLAQAAIEAAAANTTATGQQTGATLTAQVQAQTDRMRIAADLHKARLQVVGDLAKAALSAYTGIPMGGIGGGGGGASHSQDGAKVNYFDRNRGQELPGGSRGGGSGAGTPNGAGSGGQTQPGTDSTTWASTSNDDYSRNPAIRAATGGGYPQMPWLNDIPRLLLAQFPLPSPDGGGTLVSGPGAWPHLDGLEVQTRIRALQSDADLFRQGRMGLCTAAAFYHHIIQRNPLAFSGFAYEIYGLGTGRLGGLTVDAGDDLRDADYKALALASNNFPPQADWMLMSSLRDGKNIVLDFEGGPNESEAIATSVDEASGWYRDTGFYTSVAFSQDRSISAVKALKKDAKTHLALFIRVNMIKPGDMRTHLIPVESPIAIDNAANTITFDYWTWGRSQPYGTVSMPLSQFQADYLGVLTAKF